MRTTIELDDDLTRELKDRAHQQGATLRQTLNLVLRRGLDKAKPATASTRYRCPSAAMGHPVAPSIDLDKALAIAGALEDAETARELELRK
jgi:hypothetical protein